MYREYFGFREMPFSIAPDPRYLYLSGQHREALAHLTYGINSDGGFVMLTGEVGTGKTTVCRCLLEQIRPDTRIAYIINPKITVSELLTTICDEFGIPGGRAGGSLKVLVDLINGFLIETRAAGARAVVIIDEAQNLEPEVLEQLRLLTNLETSQEKLLQIILLGQPELRAMLARPQLRQLNQRITARYHLGPLRRGEVAAYVAHRLRIAGLRGTLFPPPTIRKLYLLSGGIPRLINVLCDRALIGTYVQEGNQVTRGTLARAAREVFGENASPRRVPPALPWALAALLASAVVVLIPPALNRSERALNQSPAPAPAAQPPAAAETAQETSRWIFSQPGAPGEDRAYADIFALWGAAYRTGDPGSACLQAQEAGLRCYTSRGGLDDLRRFNRPAVLHLVDEQGRECHVALTGLGEAGATILAGGAPREIPLVWFGEYTLLWRPPPGFRVQVSPGDRGPAVSWLDRRLAAASGESYRQRDTPVYDPELTAAVRAFQSGQGLDVDGIAGPRTLLRLSATAGDGAPVLASGPGE